MYIYLLQDTVSGDYYFLTNISFLFNKEPYVKGGFYNCLGECELDYWSVSPPTPEYRDFRSTKKTWESFGL